MSTMMGPGTSFVLMATTTIMMVMMRRIGAVNYDVLDGACAISTTPSTCSFHYKQVPIFIHPVDVDGSIGGCISDGSRCKYDRTIVCDPTGLSEVVHDAALSLGRCAVSADVFGDDTCPSSCSKEIAKAMAAHLRALGQDTFTTMAAAEALLAEASPGSIRRAITQLLLCTTDVLTPPQLAALTLFVQHSTRDEPDRTSNAIGICQTVDDVDVKAAFDEYRRLERSVDMVRKTTTMTAPTSRGRMASVGAVVVVVALLIHHF